MESADFQNLESDARRSPSRSAPAGHRQSNGLTRITISQRGARSYFAAAAIGGAALPFRKETRFGKYRSTTISPTLCTQRYGTLTARLPSTRSGFVSPTKIPSTAPLSTSTTKLFTFPRNTPLWVFTWSPMISDSSSSKESLSPLLARILGGGLTRFGEPRNRVRPERGHRQRM